jgi:hypothetical protein
MKRKNSLSVRIAATAAVALWAGAGFASAQTPQSAQATLPQAAYRITNWGILEGYKGMWIEAGDQSYYGEFLSPCIGAEPDRIIFKFNADGSLNRFSKVIVPHARQVCAFKNFVASAVPAAASPSRALR